MNKQGNVVRIIREHYLRDDIWCNSKECPCGCKHENPVLSAAKEDQNIKKRKKPKKKDNQLPALRSSSSQQNTKKQNKGSLEIERKSTSNIENTPIVHYIVPTVDLVLNYLEIFELNELKNIIFCETVLQESQFYSEKRMPNRIRAIINDSSLRSSILYCNEHSKDTYVERIQNETTKQRNIRAIATVAEWYRTHLQYKVPIILLTMNEEESDLLSSIGEGVIVMTIEQYINDKTYFKEVNTDMKNLYTSLTDAIASRQEKESSNLYDKYLPLDVLESGLKNNLFIKGVLHVSKHNPQEAYVKYSKKGENEEQATDSMIVISGNKDRNRAIHGDIVVVQPYPENEWKKEEKDASSKPKGKVVGVLQRNWRLYVACLQVDEEDHASFSDKYVLCIPLDYRIPKIRIMTRQKDILKNARIVVRIHEWEPDSMYPYGIYVRTLGPIGDLNVETEGLLIENGLDQVFKFSPQALAELPIHSPDHPYVIPQKEIEQRRDVRFSHTVISIDPIGCEDIDDALSVKFLPNNNIEIGVHIADVSHYVSHESQLDIEARTRSTTIYLVDRRLDMLPALLSADLCSLRMNEDRLAVSVFWEFTKDGRLVNLCFERTVIRSKYALHYEQAHNIINDIKAPPVPPIPGVNWREAEVKEEDIPELKRSLIVLQQFAQEIRRKRISAGALELESLDEVKIKLDESKEVKEIEVKKDLKIHHTISEWMIYANATVAQRIYQCFPRSAILRRHPFPRMENFQTLIKAANAKGFAIRTESNYELAKSLDIAVDNNDPYVNLLLRALATQAMAEALYFSSGSFEPKDYFHYGLGLNFYTHFTSPIRRYADILAHRMLLTSLEEEKKGLSYQNIIEHNKLVQICDHMNDRHRSSKRVELESVDWFRALYIKKMECVVDEAIIYNLKSNVIYVFVPTYRIKSRIYIETKKGDLIIPEREQREYNLLENEPLDIPSSNPDITFTKEFDEQNLRLSIILTHKVKNKATTMSRFSYKIFDHLKVNIRTNESKAHLPQIQLQLISFETSRINQKTNKSDLKKQLQEYNEQVTKEDMERESKISLHDTGYEQSTSNIQTMLAQLDINYQQDITSSQITVPTISSSKYSQEDIQKKLKSVTHRLKLIEKIKKKQASNEPLTKEEEEKLSSEQKYLNHLRKLKKLTNVKNNIEST